MLFTGRSGLKKRSFPAVARNGSAASVTKRLPNPLSVGRFFSEAPDLVDRVRRPQDTAISTIARIAVMGQFAPDGGEREELGTNRALRPPSSRVAPQRQTTHKRVGHPIQRHHRHRRLVHRHRLERGKLLRPPGLFPRRQRSLQKPQDGVAGRHR